MQCTTGLNQLNDEVCMKQALYPTLYWGKHIKVEFSKVKEQRVSYQPEISMTLWVSQHCIYSQAKSHNITLLVIQCAHTFRSLDK